MVADLSGVTMCATHFEIGTALTSSGPASTFKFHCASARACHFTITSYLELIIIITS